MKKSYIASTLSIGLLLLLLGFAGYYMLSADRFARSIDNRSSVIAFMGPAADSATTAQAKARLSGLKNVETIEFLTSEQSERYFESQTGFRADSANGYITLPAMIIIEADGSHTNQIRKELSEIDGIKGTFITQSQQKSVSTLLTFGRRVVICIGCLLLFVVLSLMYYTLKLAILGSSKEIRTMQMVGAKNSFIKKPYIRRSAYQGVIGALIASGLLIGAIELFAYTTNTEIIRDAAHWKEIAMIGSSLCIAGVVMCMLFTVIALGIIVKKTK